MGKGRRNAAENGTVYSSITRIAAIGEYYSCVLHRRCIRGCTCAVCSVRALCGRDVCIICNRKGKEKKERKENAAASFVLRTQLL